MAGNHLFIRLDLSNDKHIGPGKIAPLEAIRAEGSILVASSTLECPIATRTPSEVLMMA
jgi:molybdenum-dependent DNA-binding transcriptional regulator ModE